MFHLSGIAVAMAMLLFVKCGKPSLSDPLGLQEPSFKFGIKDYVSGSLWPKPQEEARENVSYSLDPVSFRYLLSFISPSLNLTLYNHVLSLYSHVMSLFSHVLASPYVETIPI